MTDEDLNAIEARQAGVVDRIAAIAALTPLARVNITNLAIQDVSLLLAEVRRLREAESKIYCAFCGWQQKIGHVQGEAAMATAMIAMARHISECDKHPMSHAVKEVLRLKGQIAELAGRFNDPQPELKE